MSNNLDKAMTPEQFTQVVEAILEGKYSWACVLILKFAGYNPVHYMPYRTYIRLVKDNQNRRSQSAQQGKQPAKIHDLNYAEPLHAQKVVNIRGGRRTVFPFSWSHPWRSSTPHH
ncbi:MAG: HetP family heterocyst commitment protein [Merismopedia sp. SIO2A8]|nr:HetP family heterocyst commitment protein [Merismopedia sp. SIO2A8]